MANPKMTLLDLLSKTEQGADPGAPARRPAVRASFPALYGRASGLSEERQMARFRASEVSNPETRWRGENVSGWSNLAFDQLVDAFNVTIDPNERVQQRTSLADSSRSAWWRRLTD